MTTKIKMNLNLSKQARRIVRRLGVTSIEELETVSKSELLLTRGCMRAHVAEVVEALAAHGKSLRGELPDGFDKLEPNEKRSSAVERLALEAISNQVFIGFFPRDVQALKHRGWTSEPGGVLRPPSHKNQRIIGKS